MCFALHVMTHCLLQIAGRSRLAGRRYHCNRPLKWPGRSRLAGCSYHCTRPLIWPTRRSQLSLHQATDMADLQIAARSSSQLAELINNVSPALIRGTTAVEPQSAASIHGATAMDVMYRLLLAARS